MGTGQRIKTRREFIKLAATAAAASPFWISCAQNSNSSFDPDSIKKFRKGFSGNIILPGETAYEVKRWSRVINSTMDKHPVIIATCKNEEDVLRSIEFGTPLFDLSQYMHGEVCRALPDTTASDLRNPGAAHLAFDVTWQDLADTVACMAWIDETYEQLKPYAGGRIYANCMSVSGGSSANAVFGTSFPRLAKVKNKYDPDNIFHLNQNILPG